MMIAQDMLSQLQHAPIAERIQVIELILQSLKHDIEQAEPPKRQHQPFTVRQFNLGRDILVDRDAIYRERGL